MGGTDSAFQSERNFVFENHFYKKPMPGPWRNPLYPADGVFRASSYLGAAGLRGNGSWAIDVTALSAR